MDPTRYIWMNGELLEWERATVHVATHGLHYGTGVFEGIRCYETAAGPAAFRLDDHLRRLATSARILGLPLPYAVEELADATLELLSANALPAAYVRPIAFYGYGELGVRPRRNPVDVAILSSSWTGYHEPDASCNGVTAMVSSWRRVGSTAIPHAAKATGVYVNSMLAIDEAVRSGCDEAILLGEDGCVADASGESVFAIRDGVLSTPDPSASILPGITRRTILELAEELGIATREARLLRTDLYAADELFLAGTAAEIVPVRSIDGRELTAPGPVTERLRAAYADATAGRLPGRQGWLARVPVRSAA